MKDKHNQEIVNGARIKESWYFHGFFGDSLFSMQQVKNANRSFRFTTFIENECYDVNRVNRMGWPVSDYEVEVVSEQQVNEAIAAARYNDYYRVYRENEIAI